MKKPGKGWSEKGAAKIAAFVPRGIKHNTTTYGIAWRRAHQPKDEPRFTVSKITQAVGRAIRGK